MVLVITLLATVFLASLVFYVFNLGHGTRSRVETQNAADAAAMSAAGWAARAKNTIAMNNVAIARQLALVNVLDAMPQTVDLALIDQRAMLEGVRRDVTALATPGHVRDELIRLDAGQDMLADQVTALEQMQALFAVHDVRETTYYQTPTGNRGRLWQAMAALDALSEATAASAGAIVAAAAQDAVDANLPSPDEGEHVGIVLHAGKPVRAERGTFHDLRGPVLTGMTRSAQEAAIDSERPWYEHRGPFDAVFGWRDPVYKEAESEEPSDSPVTSSRAWQNPTLAAVDTIGAASGGGSSWDAGAIPGPSPPGPSLERVAYEVYGTLEWLLRERPMALSRPWRYYSRLESHFNTIVDLKNRYFTGPVLSPPRVNEPDWITDYSASQFLAMDELDPTPIRAIAYLRLVFDDQPGAGPLEPRREHGTYGNRIFIDSGRWDTWPNPPGLTHSHRIGGTDIWRSPNVTDGVRNYYVFIGVDVGEEVDIENPYNYDTTPDIAPFEFDDDVANPAMLPDRHMSYLAVVRRAHASPMWSGAFDRGIVGSGQLAVAQAHVFNDHSWDLWTQMWHGRLVPVTDFDWWVDLAEAQDAELWHDMHSVRELAPLLLGH